jgi:hypothetical protein
MPKTAEQWILFEYVEGQFTPLSKPFKSKKLAEKEQEKHPDKERRRIGLGRVEKGRY